MTSLPEQPGAAAVVLLREEESDDAHNHRMVYMRIKVLTEPGRKYADVEFLYSRRSFIIYDVAGRTVHGDGTIIPFTGKPFDKVIVKNKERGKEIRYQVKSFSLPDVQVGSILKYRYYLRYDEHSFYAPEWEVQWELFQKKASFKFYPYARLLQLAHGRVGAGVAWTSLLPTGVQVVDHQLPRSSLATSRTAGGYVDLQMTNVPPLLLSPICRRYPHPDIGCSSSTWLDRRRRNSGRTKENSGARMPRAFWERRMAWRSRRGRQ